MLATTCCGSGAIAVELRASCVSLGYKGNKPVRQCAGAWAWWPAGGAVSEGLGAKVRWGQMPLLLLSGIRLGESNLAH